MINWIIVIAVWVILTEILYFVFGKDCATDFGESIGMQVASAFISLLIVVGLVIIPMALANEHGIKVYYWVYGTISTLVALVCINWFGGEALDTFIDYIERKRAKKK